MKVKQPVSWLLMVLISLCIIEACLRLYFFQIRSEYPLAAVQAFHEVEKLIYRSIPPKPVGIWTRDTLLGYSHIENSTGTHETPDFKATYTIGVGQERYIPIPDNPVGRVLFLGGSFSFGHGVNDDESYPYILSTYWTAWHIVNKSVMGWGTSHAYITLSKEIESHNPPAMVIYTMIPHHITRNYIRKRWVRTLAEYDRGHPHFELINGALVFQEVISSANSLEDTREIRKKELELTKAFLVEMQDICNNNNIPLVVILLGNNFPYAISRTLTDNSTLVLDLTEIRMQGFEGDRHPNRSDHRRIAEAVLNSFVPKILDCSERSHGAESSSEDCPSAHMQTD